MTLHHFVTRWTPSGRRMTQRQCEDCLVWETPFSRGTECPQPETPMPSQPAPDQESL